MRVLLIGALALACGCASASLVESRKRRPGPVAEAGIVDPGGGRVRYPLQGPRWLVRRRRDRAFALMAKYCGGGELVRVRGEATREDAETPFHSDDLEADKLSQDSHYKVSAYRHVEFECLRTK